MKQLFTLLFLLPATLGFTQCDGERYRELVFESFSKTADLHYGSNYDNNGTLQDLALDVYVPNGDSETARPLVIMAHGGSFMFGSKEGEDVVPLCENLARMGYVVASINYRLGISLATLNLEQPATEAVVRGFHDIKAAVRYFRKDVAENGNTFAINSDQIYLGGVSAGGFLTLHAASLDEESELPEAADYTIEGLGGGIEGETGNSGYSSEISGIINMCGALKDTAYISENDPPMLNFHGTEDTVVPFGSETLFLLGSFAITDVDGSASVAEQCDIKGVENCFEIYEGEGHTPHTFNVAHFDTTLSIISNFLSHLVCPDITLDCSYRELQTSIEEWESTSLPTLWPNPATDKVRIELPGNMVGSALEVRNVLGQLVARLEDTTLVQSLDISGWPAGTYILRSPTSGLSGVRFVKR